MRLHARTTRLFLALVSAAIAAGGQAAVQRDPLDRGLPADMDGMLYKNGFRALNVSVYFECREPTWVIVLAGFGRIVVVLFPNDTAYYRFSDGGSQRWLAAVREAHRIRPFCS